uniref:F-box domain-containing protein n=1 Tax=Romanomermis culicivorax TaxID=13658 RepID=A0A915IQA2_ROMCU
MSNFSFGVHDILRDEYDDVWICIFSKYISILDRVRVEKVCSKWRRMSKKAWSQVRSLSLQDLYGTDNDFVTIRDTIKALLFVLERSGWFLNRLDLSMTGGYAITVGPEINGKEPTGYKYKRCIKTRSNTAENKQKDMKTQV